jgi:hypothetical protein
LEVLEEVVGLAAREGVEVEGCWMVPMCEDVPATIGTLSSSLDVTLETSECVLVLGWELIAASRAASMVPKFILDDDSIAEVTVIDGISLPDTDVIELLVGCTSTTKTAELSSS